MGTTTPMPRALRARSHRQPPSSASDARPVPLLADWRRSDSLDDLARWTGRARLVAIAAAALGAATLIAGG